MAISVTIPPFPQPKFKKGDVVFIIPYDLNRLLYEPNICTCLVLDYNRYDTCYRLLKGTEIIKELEEHIMDSFVEAEERWNIIHGNY